jgi:hypothetical protein
LRGDNYGKDQYYKGRSVSGFIKAVDAIPIIKAIAREITLYS